MFRITRLATGVTMSLCILLLALIFTACQPAVQAPNTPTPTPAPVATQAPAATDTPAAEASADAGTDAGPPPLVSLFDMLARAEGLEDYVAALENAGLAEQLQGADPYTLLVAPNGAFDALPQAVRDDAELMQEIMNQHIIEGAYLIQDLLDSDGVTNMAGAPLTLEKGVEGGTINGANILGVDFAGQNGVIQVIDTLILPPDRQAEVMALYPSVADEETYPMQGNIHIDQGETSPVAYNSTPPTSGPHFGNIVAWQVYDKPFVYEQLIHNLEDSGVIIYYQCTAPCPDLFQQLSDFAQTYIDAGRHLVVVPNDPTWTTPEGATPHVDMGAPIAVTAWQKLLKLDEFDGEKMAQFVEAYEGIDHHVK